MKSFTRKLILYCTGVIFIGFFVVYILFNAMVGSYIRAEAEQELNLGIIDAENISRRLYLSMTEVEYDGESENDDISVHNEITQGITIASGIRTSEINPINDIPISSVIRVSPYDGFHISSLSVSLGHAYTFLPMRQSIINTGTIMIDAHMGEIIMPSLEFLPDNQIAQIEFLSMYYLDNRSLFANGGMVIATDANSTHYMRAINQTMGDESISILLYTDISSAIAFMNSMNNRLILLLVLSGLASLTIAALMSIRFKKAINRLCKHAETIGHGDFDKTAGAFHDSEFTRLSNSMNEMSNMLKTYEGNQKQFFQNASHELRTPLMSIQGYAEGIIDGIFDKDEAAEIILSEGQKMTDMVGELLFLSRMDSHPQKSFTVSPINIRGLLSECAEQMKPIAANVNKTITLSETPPEAAITGDREKLTCAIINVLSNAVRHAKSDITLNCVINENTLKIEVCDDGDGIDAADLPRLFERFYKGRDGNAGLGLAISKEIIKNHGGDITAGNKPKGGAVFVVELPLIPS
ncbi:MAG: HAMP domain-containing histidine kinase [Defluviitaleaceae bacterium]|nr:HAMP domain-containing histidine kinase [Defluviitaleaceae bacterium]